MTDTVNVSREAVVAALKEADRPFRQTLSDYRYQILAEAMLVAAPKVEPVSDPYSDELLEAKATVLDSLLSAKIDGRTAKARLIEYRTGVLAIAKLEARK